MSLLERVQARESQLNAKSSAQQPLQLKSSELRGRLKKDLIEHLGLQTVARMAQQKDVSFAREELRVAAETLLNTGSYQEIAPQEVPELITQVLNDIVGLGPLQPLLDDPTITEVMVNGCDSLYFERDGHMYTAEHVFDSPEQILLVVDRILSPLGRRLDEKNPLVNARLSNGDRVNVVGSPIALDAPCVTIRKFSDRVCTLHELVEHGSLPSWYAQLLRWAVQCRQDIAVAGGTGSGKTTLLNALSCEIDHGERIITIEDSAELRFDSHPHVVQLEAREASLEGSGAISIRELVRNALRMRPDRIVVGEVRGEETIDMLQAMNTGHDGSLTTLHAGTAQEAILRLVLMARFGMDLPADLIEEQVATALDLIVMSTRLPDGSRCITSLSEVSRAKTAGVELTECVTFDRARKTWQLKHPPSFVSEALEAGILDAQEVEIWEASCSSRQGPVLSADST